MGKKRTDNRRRAREATADSDKGRVIVARSDALSDEVSGRGTALDKLSRLQPLALLFSPQECRSWYRANGIFASIVDAPAEDATREGITIETNLDDEPGATPISRLIENRLEELNFWKKYKDLKRYARLYQEGGFMFLGVDSPIPQTTLNIADPLPEYIKRISYINVFGPDRVSITDDHPSPLSPKYHLPELSVDGYPIHPDRHIWLCPKYVKEDKRGISVIEGVLESLLGNDTAIYAINTMFSELGAKVFKSPLVNEEDPTKLKEFLRELRWVVSSQSAIAIGEGEELNRLATNLNSSGFKDAFEFLLNAIAGASKIPKSRLNGAAQGAIQSGQYDLRTYYDEVGRDQENEDRPNIERIISLIIRERDGEIYKRLGERVNSLDWKFEFNPLWRLTEKEESEIFLNRARANDIWIARGVLDADEARTREFPDLETFQGSPGFSPTSEYPDDPSQSEIKPESDVSEATS